jgi:hypothetical protein
MRCGVTHAPLQMLKGDQDGDLSMAAITAFDSMSSSPQ